MVLGKMGLFSSLSLASGKTSFSVRYTRVTTRESREWNASGGKKMELWLYETLSPLLLN